jgi:hypothetical protein
MHNKDAILLAAASKKKHRRLQLLQRHLPCDTFSSQINRLPKSGFKETGE